MKGSDLPDELLAEPVEPVLEPTEVGADWDSVGEVEVVEVVVDALVLLALVL